jgi:hypothetical protein
MPGRETARGFVLRDASAAAPGVFSCEIRKGDQAMPFQKGETGNPACRPRGARNRTTMLMRNLLVRPL